MNPIDSAIVATLNQYRLSAMIVAAVELGVFRKLAPEPLSAQQLAEGPPMDSCHVEHLERLLVGLEAIGLVRLEDGKWALSEAGERFTAEDSSVEEHARLAQEYQLAWSRLAYSVQWGCSGYQTAFGCNVWRGREIRPRQHAAFTKVMRLHAEQAVDLILKAEVLDDEGQVVDIAGGEGLILIGLLLSRPKLQGHLLELPEMIVRAKELPGLGHVSSRITLREGDVFHLPERPGLLPKAPFLLVNVLHDWPDDKALLILAQCRKYASKLVIVERLVDPENRRATALHDLHMMAVTGGKQRTLEQMEALLTGVGWALGEVVHSDSLSLVEAV